MLELDRRFDVVIRFGRRARGRTYGLGMGMMFGAYIYIGLLAWYIGREIDQVKPSHQSKPNRTDIVTKTTITMTIT
jgi:hypothetical protein